MTAKLREARAAREEAARAYLRALQASIAAGEASGEMQHDHGALWSAGWQLLDLCGKQGVGAPMVLVP